MTTQIPSTNRGREFRKLFVDMYGEQLTKRFLTDDIRISYDERYWSTFPQDTVRSQVHRLAKEALGITADIECIIKPKQHKDIEWVIDLPGFTNSLDKDDEHGRVVFSVGQEPLAHDRCVSVAYGMTDEEPHDYLLTILTNVLSERDNYLDGCEVGVRKEGLGDLYVTDLCFFAPRGGGRELSDFRAALEQETGYSYDFLKSQIARRFIPKQLKIVAPRVVYGNGMEAFDSLVDSLGIGRGDDRVPDIPDSRRLRIRRSQAGSMGVFGAPHSGRRNRGWWRRFWAQGGIPSLRNDMFPDGLSARCGKTQGGCHQL